MWKICIQENSDLDLEYFLWSRMCTAKELCDAFLLDNQSVIDCISETFLSSGDQVRISTWNCSPVTTHEGEDEIIKYFLYPVGGNYDFVILVQVTHKRIKSYEHLNLYVCWDIKVLPKNWYTAVHKSKSSYKVNLLKTDIRYRYFRVIHHLHMQKVRRHLCMTVFAFYD